MTPGGEMAEITYEQAWAACEAGQKRTWPTGLPGAPDPAKPGHRRITSSQAAVWVTVNAARATWRLLFRTGGQRSVVLPCCAGVLQWPVEDGMSEPLVC